MSIPTDLTGLREHLLTCKPCQEDNPGCAYVLDTTWLPTYGDGGPVERTVPDQMWSWDDTHALVGESFTAEDLRIIPLSEAFE